MQDDTKKITTVTGTIDDEAAEKIRIGLDNADAAPVRWKNDEVTINADKVDPVAFASAMLYALDRRGISAETAEAALRLAKCMREDSRRRRLERGR